jgi:hypothetical protein
MAGPLRCRTGSAAGPAIAGARGGALPIGVIGLLIPRTSWAWSVTCASTPGRPGQRESRAALARARLVCYLTAKTSTSWMSGALASRSADTLASAAGIWPLMCAVRASSVTKVSKMP